MISIHAVIILENISLDQDMAFGLRVGLVAEQNGILLAAEKDFIKEYQLLNLLGYVLTMESQIQTLSIQIVSVENHFKSQRTNLSGK
mmetsp:Transcript_18316/g.18000  ORF Transcript_18316/g.18000 Transcript_18316/m.18000 type:complete len:87 (+) Transcript_18316:855-1115(+)